MVLSLTPPLGNSSNPCVNLIAYNEGRPTSVSLEYIQSNRAIVVCCLILNIIALLGTFMFAHHSRFTKIRPRRISVFVLVALDMYVVAGVIAIPYNFPCIVSAILFPVGVACMCTSIAVRALKVTFEASYAQKTKKLLGVMEGGDENVSQISNNTMSRTLLLLFRVAFGLMKVEDLDFDQVSVARNNYSVFALVFTLLGLFSALILLIALPQMRNECVWECREVFAEVPIILIAVISSYLLVMVKCITVAFKAVGWDDQGVMHELFGIALFPSSMALVVWIIIWIDPNNMGYQRLINWHLLFFLPGFFFWWFSFGLQFLMVIKLILKKRHQRLLVEPHKEETSNGDMRTMCDQNEQINQEFREFAAKQYCSELLLFLDDVRAFKLMFFDKAETWRRSKVNKLVHMYIENGSSLEVNISGEVRKKILATYMLNVNANDCLFDRAVVEVENMLNLGVWAHFMSKKRKLRAGGKGQLSTQGL